MRSTFARDFSNMSVEGTAEESEDQKPRSCGRHGLRRKFAGGDRHRGQGHRPGAGRRFVCLGRRIGDTPKRRPRSRYRTWRPVGNPARRHVTMAQITSGMRGSRKAGMAVPNGSPPSAIDQ